MTWYAVTVKQKPVLTVRRALRRLGIVAYVPAQVQRNGRHGKRRRTPLMQYIFVRCPSPHVTALWQHSILSVEYVRGFVGTERYGEAVAIADDAIEKLQGQVRLALLAARGAAAKRSLRYGDAVTITAGHLAGKRGRVVWARGERAEIEAYLFGAQRVTNVAVANLEAA